MRKSVGLLRKIQSVVVMGVLLVALSVLNFFLGCELETEEPKAYYGPPPDGYFNNDIDEPTDIYIDQAAEMPMAYYGPVPFDAGITDATDDVPEPKPDMVQTYYGPAPADLTPSTDVVEEDVPEPQLDAVQAYYGPMPVDAGPTDVVEDLLPDEDVPPRFYYGPMPADLTPSTDVIDEEIAADAADVPEQTWYGPAPMYGAQESF